MSNNSYHNYQACPETGVFWSFLGMFLSITLAGFGSSFGTAKSGVGMATGGLINAAPLTKLTLPVIMAGVLAIYGLITLLVINTKVNSYQYGMPLYIGYSHFAAGACNGIASLSAGIAIGVAGQQATKSVAQQPTLFVVMIIVMIFGEALALFGLIVSLLLTSITVDSTVCGTIS